MRNVSDKSCRENQNKHFTLNNFLPENRAVYEIMWKTMVEPDRPLMAIRRMRFACWMTKTTDTLKIFNTYCFSTATIVSRTRLSVTWYIHTLPLSLLFDVLRNVFAVNTKYVSTLKACSFQGELLLHSDKITSIFSLLVSQTRDKIHNCVTVSSSSSLSS